MLPDAMRVELSPSRVEVTVGESVVLSCKATHDTSLDVAFQWYFNQRPITFQQDGGHFEYIQTVRARVRTKVRLISGFVILLYSYLARLANYLSISLARLASFLLSICLSICVVVHLSLCI